MIKTEMQIERDFTAYVKNSELGNAIRGEIYRSEMRPADAKTEDLVIKFLTGLDTQVQTGIIVLNLYVPDIAYGKNGRKVGDKARIAELQTLILSFIADCDSGGEYLLTSESTPTSYAIDDIEQHIIAVRINFKRLAT